MVVRATYSLDEATVRRLRRTAERLGKPQSQIVREAIADYAARCDRLSEVERLRMLEVLGRLRSAHVTGSAEAVEAELREIRESRRVGWDRDSDRR
ncbi:MAG: ribbon-helix-helix protein, CopG family [Acidobacteriota bacterium]|nr:ribbon-helix-helix protein, CopG family [Acidobacteriota bacterium]